MAIKPTFRITFDATEAKAARKRAIPSMAAGCVISTAHGDIHVNGPDADEVMQVVATIAMRRSRTRTISTPAD